jgi:integrase
MGSVFNRGSKDRPLWYVQYREGGRWKMANSRQTSKAKALRFLHAAEERVAQGKVGIEPEKPGTLFNAVADEWLRLHSKVELVSHDDNVGRMKHLREEFAKVQVADITAGRIDLFKAQMAAEPRRDPKGEPVTDPKTGEEVRRWAPATVNRTLALLRKVLNDSVRWGHLTHAPKVRLLKVPEQPFLFLRREQATKFLALAAEKAPNDAPLYQAAIYTGARMGELYGLRWSDLDLEGQQVTIARSYEQPFPKSKKPRHIPMGPELAATLRAWRGRCPSPAGLVFPMPDGTMRTRERAPRGFAELAEAVRVPGKDAITFHDLRHTAASLMVMSGVNLRTVQRMLGHSTVTVTEKYAHLADDFVATEIAKFSLKPTRLRAV